MNNDGLAYLLRGQGTGLLIFVKEQKFLKYAGPKEALSQFSCFRQNKNKNFQSSEEEEMHKMLLQSCRSADKWVFGSS